MQIGRQQNVDIYKPRIAGLFYPHPHLLVKVKDRFFLQCQAFCSATLTRATNGEQECCENLLE